MAETPYDVDFDGTNVWVQVEGECIARFGKVAYEVYSAIPPRRPIAIAKGAAIEHWRAFERAVWNEHGIVVPRSATPHGLHEAVGLTYLHRVGDFRVPVSTLARDHDPFAVDVWGRCPVTRDVVKAAILTGDLEPDHVEMALRESVSPGWDTRRIAYFVLYPEDTPIQVEVTNEEGDFGINDGFHRLAAAIYRGDAEIAATLSGYVVGFDRHFGDRVLIEAPSDEDEIAMAFSM